MESMKAIFSTLYACSETAKRELAELFAQTGPHRGVLFNSSGPTQFILQFSSGDGAALSTFGALVERFTIEAIEQAKPDHVSRVRGTISVIDDDTSEPEEDFVNVGVIEQPGTDATVVAKWSGTLDAHLTREIGDLSGCGITQKLDSPGLEIRGARKDAEKVIMKLDVVLSLSEQRKSFPLIYDYLMSEGDINVCFQLSSLKAIRVQRPIKSLVPPNLAKGLEHRLVVIMMKGGQLFPDFTFKNKPPHSGESILWKDAPYAGIESTKAPVPFEMFHVPKTKKPIAATVVEGRYRTVDDWVDETATIGLSADDPFKPHIIKPHTTNEQNIKEPVDLTPTLAPTPTRPRPVKARKAKGAMEEEPPLTKPAAMGSASNTFLHELAVTSQESNFGSKSSADTVAKSIHSNGGNAFDVTAGYAQDLLELQLTDGPEIQPPFMPAKSTTTEFTTNSAFSQETKTYAPVSAAKEGKLIDILAPDSPKKERKTQTNNGQKFKQTMNQRKANSERAPNAGEASLLKQYDDGVVQLLSMTVSMPGRVGLAVNVGHLLIDNTADASENTKRTFVCLEWPRVFPTAVSARNKIRSEFTPRLTSSGLDADLIIQLKRSSGRNMFTPEPCSRATFYRLTCASLDKSKDDMVIEVFENKTTKIQSFENLIGALHLHFPRHLWDARIAVTVSDAINKDQLPLAEHVRDYFRVVPAANQSHLDIYAMTGDKKITFRSIEIHRTTRHRSIQYPDLLLVVSEVQDANLDLATTDAGIACHASTKPKKEMINDGKLWWEVSVASATAENILKENETLELGETCAWQPNDIVDASIVRQMYHLADDIVTRIDNVGYYNKGPKTVSSAGTSEKKFAKPSEPTFW